MDGKSTLPFGRRLRELRQAKRLSQRDLAQQVSIDFTYLSKIENNRADPPSDDVIRSLAQALDADPEEMLALAAKVSQKELRKTVAEDPRVGVLFRKLQSGSLSRDQIGRMLRISGSGERGDGTESK